VSARQIVVDAIDGNLHGSDLEDRIAALGDAA
jgi:hypothetical protein